MKPSFILFMLVFALLFGPCRSAGQTAASPFSIAISTDAPTVKVGAVLSPKVHITNTSDHDINVSSSYFEGADASYRQDVRDSYGNLPKRAARETSTRTSGHWIRHTLKPGQSVDTVTSIRSLGFCIWWDGIKTYRVFFKDCVLLIARLAGDIFL